MIKGTSTGAGFSNWFKRDPERAMTCNLQVVSILQNMPQVCTEPNETTLLAIKLALEFVEEMGVTGTITLYSDSLSGLTAPQNLSETFKDFSTRGDAVLP